MNDNAGSHIPPVSAERDFFDTQYRQFLSLPDHSLAFGRRVFLSDLDNPQKPVYERRALYRKAFDILFAQSYEGLRVMDYGCGTGDWALLFSEAGAESTMLELSPVAIEVGLLRAKASGLAGRVHGIACDASSMEDIPSHEFDLIFGCFALHHTLKRPGAFAELIRVLKPGGKLFLIETYGNNPILNSFRRLRARWAREAEEQGEGLIFSQREIALLREHFERVTVAPTSLLSMAKRLFRGKFHRRVARWTLRMLDFVDSRLLKLAPGLGKYCGEVLIIAERPKGA